jgi:hypothetical protein
MRILGGNGKRITGSLSNYSHHSVGPIRYTTTSSDRYYWAKAQSVTVKALSTYHAVSALSANNCRIVDYTFTTNSHPSFSDLVRSDDLLDAITVFSGSSSVQGKNVNDSLLG